METNPSLSAASARTGSSTSGTRRADGAGAGLRGAQSRPRSTFGKWEPIPPCPQLQQGQGVLPAGREERMGPGQVGGGAYACA
jgi:hypothetical protein